MKIDSVREAVDSTAIDYETSVTLLDNPYFDKSIVGYVEDGDTIHLVYDMDKMIEEFVEDSNGECTRDEAIEFIEYNTLRAIPYMGKSAPIILHSLPV